MKTLFTQLILSITLLGMVRAQDLSITSFAFPGSNLASGGVYNPVLKIKNNGKTGAVSSYAGFYLSKDSILTVSDRFFTSLYIPPLAAGTEGDVSSGINLPLNIADGNYFIFVYADYQGQVFESNENNNAASYKVSITAPVTDFVITAAGLSAGSVSAGEQLSVSATINNLGNTAAYCYTGFYISTDTVFDASDIPGGSTYSAYIQPGNPTRVEGNIIVPSDIAAGSYHIIFVADNLYYVSEPNEDNNTSSKPLNITAPNYTNVPVNGNKVIYACDTKIYDHGGPANNYSAYADGSLTIYPETAGKYVSLDFTNVSLEYGLDYVTVYDGTSVSAPSLGTFSWSSGSNIFYASNTSGALTVRFHTDGSVQYSGFEAKVSCSATIPKPDLSFTNFSADSILVPGTYVNVYLTETNNGSANAPAHSIAFYLSQDSVYSIGDTFLGNYYPGSLSAGSSQGVSAYLNLPSGQYSGSYYFLAITDIDNTVNESEEGNNSKVLKVNIKKAELDLNISSLSLSYNTLTAGETINAQYVINNSGNVAAGYYSVGLYLSTDSLFNIGDTYLNTGNYYYLSPNSGSYLALDVTLPSNLSVGEYYLMAIADPLNALDEKNEGNNAFRIPLHVVKRDVDLEVSNHSLYSYSGLPGTYPGIYTEIKNNGTTSAAADAVGYYLSADSVYSVGDSFLGYYYFPVVPAGETRSAYLNLYLPSGIPTGRYYIIAVADYNGIVEETFENNNEKALAIDIEAPFTDLKISNLSTSNSNPVFLQGETLAILLTEQNTGNTSASSHYIYYYLSTDSVYNVGDTYLYSSNVSYINGNDYYYLYPYLTIPQNASPGKYYIIAIADYSNNIEESVENNNTRSLQVTVSLPNVDLSVTGVKFSGVLEPGYTFDANVTSYNSGTTTAGSHNVNFYLSQDSLYSSGDTYLSTMYVYGVPAGQSQTQ